MIEVQGIRIGMLKKDYVVLLHSDGGSRVLPMGLIPRRHSLIVSYILLGVSAIIGLVLHLH